TCSARPLGCYLQYSVSDNIFSPSRLLFIMLRRPPSTPLFPYTTLFRSHIRNRCLGFAKRHHFIDWGRGRAEGNWPSKPLLPVGRSEEHTSELQSRENLVCRLLLEKKTTPLDPMSSFAPILEFRDRANLS